MMEGNKRSPSFTGREPWLVLGLACLVIHLIFNGGYGIFRDELYFIVCGERLAWGYVDQPPLIPLLAAWSHALFGNFLVGFRLVPALALGIGVLATPARRSLLRPWLYVGALIGAILVLPNVLWQQAHGWPFLELGKAAVNGKNVALSPRRSSCNSC